MNFTVSTIALFITFLINIGTAIFVFSKNPKKSINLVFSALVFLLALWNLTNFLSDSIRDFSLSLWMSYLTMGAVLFIPCFLLYFSFLFSKKNITSWQIILIFLPGFILAPLVPTEHNIISDSYRINGTPSDFTPGCLYSLYTIFFLIYLLLFLLILLKNYQQQTSKIVQQQIIYILFGALSSGLVGIITNAILPIFFNIPFFNIFGTPFSVIFGLCTAYAITRYRFMDIRVVIRKSLLYFLLFALTIILSLGVIILLYFFMRNYLQIESNITLLISVALLIIFLPILQKNLKRLFNQYFNKELIDLSAKVEEFATSINQAHQLNDLIMRCDSFIKNKLQVNDTKFLVRDIRVSELQYICQSPTNSTIIGIAGLKDNAKYFLEQGLVILEEIKFMENSKMAINNSIRPLRKILEKNQAQILVPLINNETVHGFILLGAKVANTPYSQEDIEFIKNISQEISPALEKVLFYEEAVARVKREFGERER